MYTEEIAAKSLIKFLNSISTEEIDVGKMEMNKSEYNLIVVANELVNCTKSRIMKTINEDDCIKKKVYIRYNNRELCTELINRYIDKDNYSKDYTLDRLNGINNNNVVAVPFMHKLRVTTIGSSIPDERVIVSLKWVLNRQTKEIEMYMKHVDVRKESGCSETKVADYNRSIMIRSSIVDEVRKSNKKAVEMVEMTNSGLIKTIELKIGKKSIAIDNQYIVDMDNDYIIAEIDAAAINIKKTGYEKEIEKINKYIRYIAMHRKYIIPYKFSETNKMEIE